MSEPISNFPFESGGAIVNKANRALYAQRMQGYPTDKLSPKVVPVLPLTPPSLSERVPSPSLPLATEGSLSIINRAFGFADRHPLLSSTIYWAVFSDAVAAVDLLSPTLAQKHTDPLLTLILSAAVGVLGGATMGISLLSSRPITNKE